MKNILNIILLLPILLYLIILLFNNELLNIKWNLNLFFISFEVNIITFISAFFVLYILIIYFIFKFSTFFVTNKNKNLNDKMNKLKADMFDKEPILLEKIEQKFEEILRKSWDKNRDNIEIMKKENEKIITNLNYDLKVIKENIEKLNK